MKFSENFLTRFREEIKSLTFFVRSYSHEKIKWKNLLIGRGKYRNKLSSTRNHNLYKTFIILF